MPGAVLGRDCMLGQNVFVGNVSLGNGVRVQNNVSLYDGVSLEDNVFVGPSAVFTNDRWPRSEERGKRPFLDTRVQRGASIGANATIVAGITIGSYALIGAGSVVIRDVPDHALMVGNAARQIGWVCSCGQQIQDEHCKSCDRRFLIQEGWAC